jgi:mannose-1-phosphate guanylyltransferase
MLVFREALSPALHVVRGAGSPFDAIGVATMLSLCRESCAVGAEAILIDIGAPEKCTHAATAGLIDLCARLSTEVRVAICNAGPTMIASLTGFGLDRALPLYASVETALKTHPFRKLQLNGLRAVILCGDEGPGLRPMTDLVARPMLDVAGKPLLARILSHLEWYGVRDVILTPGHLGAQVPAYFNAGGRRTQSLFYLDDGRPETQAGKAIPTGTVATLCRLATSHFGFHDDTFILRGDSLTDIDLARMLACHRRSGAAVTIAAQSLAGDEVVAADGVLGVDVNHRIVSSEDVGRKGSGMSWVRDAGIYVIRPEILQSLVGMTGQSIAQDLLPALLRSGAHANVFREPFIWAPISCGRNYYQSVAQVLERRIPGVEPSGTLIGDQVWAAPGAVVAPAAEIVGPCHVGAGARVEGGARIIGPCAIGSNATIETRTLVRKSLIWPGTKVGAGTWIDQAVAGPDWGFAHPFADGRNPMLGRARTTVRNSVRARLSA